jgi:hypothetical protein
METSEEWCQEKEHDILHAEKVIPELQESLRRLGRKLFCM